MHIAHFSIKTIRFYTKIITLLSLFLSEGKMKSILFYLFFLCDALSVESEDTKKMTARAFYPGERSFFCIF